MTCENARKFLNRPEIVEGLHRNDKIILSEEDYQEFFRITEPCVSEEYISGSAFNTTYTIAKALDDAEISFVTPPSRNKNELQTPANFKFVPNDPNDADKMISRVSFICLEEDGNKYVLKYLGNIYEYLSENLTYVNKLLNTLAKTISASDLFILPGGITKKFPLEIFEHALNEAERNKTKLIFSLPTHSDFSEAELSLYKIAMKQAYVILGNGDELKNTLGIDVVSVAVRKLEKLSAISFITNGAAYAHVVAKGRIANIKPLPLPKNVTSVTGAGDAAFAGFIIGLLENRNPTDAAELAMKFAHEILKIHETRLLDPKHLLK